MNSQNGKKLAPYISRNDRVILFDGVCKLCSAWANFIIKYDNARVFKLATVQSQQGKAILAFYGLPEHHYETMLLVDGPLMYSQSTAFLRVMKLLPKPWPIFTVGYLLPKICRDWLYDRIALNRYRLFGKYDVCSYPSPDHESRFLHED